MTAVDAAWTWVDNLHRLAWAQRLTLALLVLSAVLNLSLATRPWIDHIWRRSYAYKGAVSALAGIWYVLLLVAVIGPDDFRVITRALQPALVFALCLSGLQHVKERRTLKRKRAVGATMAKVVDDHERANGVT